jgi:hypothetical protein
MGKDVKGGGCALWYWATIFGMQMNKGVKIYA